MSEATGPRDYSWKLNKAIRKYGGQAFMVTTLWECADEELDPWEEYFIGLFDTFGPNGYNLTKGGKSGFTYTPEVREKMSKAARKHFYGKELPSYVYYYNDGKQEGFRVKIGGKFLRVASSRMSMDEKYEEALRLRASIVDGAYDPTMDRKRVRGQAELPKYISFDPRRDGYYVRVPGHARRSFTSTSNTREENLTLATLYLESLQQ